MMKRIFQIAAVLAVFVLAGTVGFTAVAKSGDSTGHASGFLGHLHKMISQHLQHGGHHQRGMTSLIEQLELTPEQRQHLEKIHEVLGTFGSDGHASMEALHNQLVARVEGGAVEASEVHDIIDEHLEQMRGVAYAVTDELVELVNGLDGKQREMLLAHLQGHDGEHAGHDGHGGHGH